MLESGDVQSLWEIARRKGVDSSYVSRMVNLAPDIVVAILDETLPPDLTQFELAIDPPALLDEQRYARALKVTRGTRQDRERNNCSAQRLRVATAG